MSTNVDPAPSSETGRLRLAAGIPEDAGLWALLVLLGKRIGTLKILGGVVLLIITATATAVATASSVVTATKLDKQFHEHSAQIDAHPRMYKDVESLKVSRVAQRTDTKWIMRAVDSELRKHGVSPEEIPLPPEHPEENYEESPAP